MNLDYLNGIPLMIHSIDKEGNIIFVNDYWLNRLGFEKKEVIGKKSIDFLTDESKATAQKIALPLFYDNGVLKDFPYTFLSKKGEKVLVTLSANSVKDSDGQFKHSIAISTELSDSINRLQNVHSRDRVINLAAFRKNVGATQEQIASIIGVSHRTYQRIEKSEGSLRVDQLLLICEKFNYSPNMFFTDYISFDHALPTRVLLVEDEVVLGQAMKAEIESWGLNVEHVVDGKSALELIQKKNFDFVVTDIELPEVDGIKLITNIPKFVSNKLRKIVVITAKKKEEIDKALKTNEIEYIFFQKPLDFDEFKRSIFSDYIP